MKDFPLVSIGFCNTNRLFYLKSCVESFMSCITHPNVEWLVVDNASVEEGTDEYLVELKARGVKVHKTERRAPNDEFAAALNWIVDNSKGDFVIPLQGDMQCILQGDWLQEFIKFYSEHIHEVGCIVLDAQRNKTNKAHTFSAQNGDKCKFVYDLSRPPASFAADVIYSRQMLKLMGQWKSKGNLSHEGGHDSETDMLHRTVKTLMEKNIQMHCALPITPVAAAIYTDERGTMGRVRRNVRFGQYWQAKDETGWKYYEISDYEEAVNKYQDRIVPVGIEDIAKPIGFQAPIDENGDWLKSPINPGTASPQDLFVLYEEDETNTVDFVKQPEQQVRPEDKHIDEWMNS